MKQKMLYLIFILLASACEDTLHEPELSSLSISDFLVQRGSMTAMEMRSSGESKDTFKTGDLIRVYGYAKLDSSAITFAEGRERFMPIEDGATGFAYIYNATQPNNWCHFSRGIGDASLKMGFWRNGFYHDFSAYYFPDEPTSNEIEYNMVDTGLPRKDLLWGATKNIYFSGETHLVPEITFRHQLSRIRVEAMHDMESITSEDFFIEQITFHLDKSEATFNLETGLWTDSIVGDIQIDKVYASLQMTNENFPRLNFIQIADWWVLPNCKLSDFEFSINQKGTPKSFMIDFENLLNDDGDELTEIITKPGYITTLRIQFGEIKQIIFTVSLQPWDIDEKESEIGDGNIIN